jgi:arabinogalactan oligomer/maltooligosaccharide transport system substrate-binding protein
MSLKRVLWSLAPIAVLSALLLSACGAGSSAPTGGSNINYSGTIVIWHGWQGSYLGEKSAIFDAYHQLHPNVNIQLVHQDDVVNKSISAENAGQGPDIIAWVDDSLGKLAKSGIVVPLDQYISADYVNATYNKAAAQAVQFNNHVYGVPESVEALTIMYNKNLVTADQLPKSTDDMLTFERNYEAQHPGMYGITWPVTGAYENADWFYGFGGFYVKADGTVGLNTPGAISAAQYIASFRSLLPKQMDYATSDSLFKEGKTAAIINGPWAYSDYANAPGNIGFATLPVVTATNTPASPFVGVKSLWVAKSATNPALDADLLKFYTNAENQINMAKVNGEIPGNLAADNDASVQALPSVGGFANQAKLGVPLPNTPFMAALWDPVAKALTAIWNGSQTPEAAMNAAQTAAQQNIQSLNS